MDSPQRHLFLSKGHFLQSACRLKRSQPQFLGLPKEQAFSSVESRRESELALETWKVATLWPRALLVGEKILEDKETQTLSVLFLSSYFSPSPATQNVLKIFTLPLKSVNHMEFVGKP